MLVLIRVFTLSLFVCIFSVAMGRAESPIVAKQAVQSLRLADDQLQIALIASEPIIEAPVACQFDEHGRLWVVEMRDYPTGPKPGEAPLGRIKRLEDTNGDGTFDSATIFAEQISFGNGLFVWNDGVIVTAAPQILFLRDTDGDGKADVRDVLYEGFSSGNPQLRVSHPILGPDGWVHVANGLRGGQVRRAGTQAGPTVEIGGKDFRFDPNQFDRYEATAGMGQFGNTFDRWGNRFVCDNRQHIRHLVFPLDASTRNPHLAIPALAEEIGHTNTKVGHGAKIYPLTKNFTTASSHSGHFTAACGIFIYNGGLLGEPHEGAVFTCDPTGNLVHEEKLIPRGASFAATPTYTNRDFLASTDDWFRPVFMTHDPDGALIVVDMYRAVIEHPDWMPPEVKNRPDLWLGKERGRIWKIVPKGFKRSHPANRLANASTEALVSTLASTNAWDRSTAQRLLIQKQDRDAISHLRQALASRSADARFLAAHLLSRFDSLRGADLLPLLSDREPGVRIAAARLAEPLLKDDEALTKAFARLAGDPDPQVRFAAAITANSSSVRMEAASKMLATIGTAENSDRWTRLATLSTAHSLSPILLQTASLPDTESTRMFAREAAAVVGSARVPAELAAILTRLAQSDAEKWSTSVLLGLAEGISRRGGRLADVLKAVPGVSANDTDTVLARVQKIASVAGDARAPLSDRLAGLQLLSQTDWAIAAPVYQSMISNSENAPELRLAAVQSAAKHPHADVAKLLLAAWRQYTPSLRIEVTEALLQSSSRITSLLDAVEAGKVKPGDIDPQRLRRLVAVKDPKIKERAGKLLASGLPADRKEVLAKYQAALALKGDVGRGKVVYTKVCANCHVVGGVGVPVGPNIADTLGKTPAQLLVDILNPNQAIDANYVSYTVTTKEGKTLTGFIASETGSSLTLKRENDQSDTILRVDIDEIKSTGLSLMPEGLEKNISEQEMADLLFYLKNWRYGDIPQSVGR